MSTSNINIRIEESTKRDLESVCKELGMSVTTAFTIFAKKMCRERRIPFDVAIDPFYSTENLDHLAPFGLGTRLRRRLGKGTARCR